MVGLIGYNFFNMGTTVGRDLWNMTLAEGGGNPSMKHNPIYVNRISDKAKTETVKPDEEVCTEEDAE